MGFVGIEVVVVGLGWVRRDDFAHCEISKCARLIFSEFRGGLHVTGYCITIGPKKDRHFRESSNHQRNLGLHLHSRVRCYDVSIAHNEGQAAAGATAFPLPRPSLSKCISCLPPRNPTTCSPSSKSLFTQPLPSSSPPPTLKPYAFAW
jgi:hypothetical protein